MNAPDGNLAATAERRRTEIAETFLTEHDVLARLDIDPTTLESNRQTRKLLAVWVPPSKSYLYPPYQFDQHGLIGEMEIILRLVRPWMTNDTGWGEVEWFLTPHTLLDARSPAEILPVEPAKVLEVARREFSEDPYTSW